MASLSVVLLLQTIAKGMNSVMVELETRQQKRARERRDLAMQFNDLGRYLFRQTGQQMQNLFKDDNPRTPK